MTAQLTDTDATVATDGISTARVFARTCAAEWTRLWTVKATWWFLAATAAMMLGISAVAGLDAADAPAAAQGDPAWAAASLTAIPAQIALLALVLTAVTSDYATGGIVPALQWTPRRSVLFLARTVVAAGTATCLGVVLAAAAALTAFVAARSALTLPLDEGLEVLPSVAFVFGTGTLLAVGLGFMLRNTAGALVSVFLLILVLPLLLPQFGYVWLTEIADVLPGTNALFLLVGEPQSRGLTDASAMTTMLAWAGGALLLGWLRLMRQDADR